MISGGAHRIVLGNEKGGTGKSTTAVHIAVALALAGHRTALIDLDARQRTATRYLENRWHYGQKLGTPLPAPASGLPAWAEGQQPTAEQIVPARPHFAVLWVQVTAIDWLHLANSGHRRAVFRAADGWQGEWRAP